MGIRQIRLCKDCKRRFTPQNQKARLEKGGVDNAPAMRPVDGPTSHEGECCPIPSGESQEDLITST